MLSQNMFNHLGVYRLSIVKKIGGFRLGFEGSQDYDLVLRCSRETASREFTTFQKFFITGAPSNPQLQPTAG